MIYTFLHADWPNPSSIEEGVKLTMRRKIWKKVQFLHNNNTALIKQIFLFDTALVLLT